MVQEQVAKMIARRAQVMTNCRGVTITGNVQNGGVITSLEKPGLFLRSLEWNLAPVESELKSYYSATYAQNVGRIGVGHRHRERW